MLQNFTSIKTLLTTAPVEQTHTVKGWVKSLRNSKKFSFMVLNDGSSQKDLQIVIDATLSNYEEVTKIGLHSSVVITGLVVASQGKGQSVEMQAKSVTLICGVTEDYPLQKKETSLEFLRENAHLRARTQLFSAVFRIRHVLAKATHDFFDQEGYYYLHTPIITASDCEGAGDMFRVSTLPINDAPKTDKGAVDFSKDYFAKETFLNVSGQLEGEAYALALGKIYTFGPTFRSENSNTARHLAEFWMIEPEVAFADLDDVAKLASDYIQFMIKTAMEKCPDELALLSQKNNPDLLSTLTHVANSEFARVTYTDAVDILKKAQTGGHKFEFAAPDWGGDLATEHERYLCEIHFKKPTIVTDYPKKIKSFYMKLNADGKTVRCMDILVPGVGEIIGGSQREDDHGKLLERMLASKLDPKDYWWYLDLRKFGGAPHAGFGLGFERAVMYITGMSNIRDVIPFPRTPRNAEF
ncbi:MAG: asparagine--tRNA ligase [Bacteriovoracaceae bacterium]|nr:asparagine--tRNA ligase [Bacteriovoracaceae bacterium]